MADNRVTAHSLIMAVGDRVSSRSSNSSTRATKDITRSSSNSRDKEEWVARAATTKVHNRTGTSVRTRAAVRDRDVISNMEAVKAAVAVGAAVEAVVVNSLAIRRRKCPTQWYPKVLST